jgi:hypothetical protein
MYAPNQFTQKLKLLENVELCIYISALFIKCGKYGWKVGCEYIYFILCQLGLELKICWLSGTSPRAFVLDIIGIFIHMGKDMHPRMTIIWFS